MEEKLEIERNTTNLLSPECRIVAPSLLPNECFYQQSVLNEQLKEAEGFPSDIASYPFGIITVLGSDRHRARKVYSDWLIHYFENFGKTASGIVGTCQDLEHMKLAVDTQPGIYIWPRKYLCPTKDNLNMVVLIIHVEGKSEVLEKFAGVASSNIFVFREREKDKLWSSVKDTFVKAALTPGTISVHSSIYLSEVVVKDEHKAANEFFKYLGGYKIETVKQSDGTDILFKDILLHFRNVEHKINAPAFNIGQAAADHGHKSTTMTPPKTASILGIENTNSGNRIPPVTTSGFTVCETTTQQKTMSNTDNKKPLTSHQCPQSCAALQKQLEIVLDGWLSKYLTPKNITDMLKCCIPYIQSDNHNVIGELSSLVGIISVYNSQLGNTFDNYVCFAGEDDKNQFHRLAESAYRHAFKTLQSKNYVHTDLTEKVLHSASIALHAHYLNENRAIALYETELTKKLLATLQLEYKDKMTSYFKSQATRSSIKNINAQVKAYILSTAEKAINFNEKFNYIFRKYFDRFTNDLNQNFLLLTKEYPAELKSNGTLSELNVYIEKYLKQFYADTLPPLHLLTTEQIIEHHQSIVSSVTSDIEWEGRETLLYRLYTHLVYITEIAEQQQDLINLTDRAKSDDGAFCLYLTSEWYTLQASTEIGMKTIQYGTHKCITPPAMAALTYQNQVLLDFAAVDAIKKSPRSLKSHGKMLQLICKSIKEDNTASYLIVEFFKKVKNDVDKCFGGNFISAIVIIPSWVNVEYRLRIRNLARCAGIKKLFLVNETALLAYRLLCLNEQAESEASAKPEFVVTVQVGDTGVNVEVFTIKPDKQIYQAAVSFTCWHVVNPAHDGVWNALNPFQGKAAVTNPFSQTRPTSDCIATLKSAFQNVSSQIGCSLQDRLVNFCITSEHPEYEHLFNDFFKEWTKVQNFQFRYALSTASQFLKRPHSLAQLVLCHAVHVKYFDVIRQTYLKKYVSVDASCDDIENQNSPAVSKEKLILLEKCSKMREQLNSGSVKVRKLMQKVIIECIERAEKAASDLHTTNEMLHVEELEIDELIEEHKFKV